MTNTAAFLDAFVGGVKEGAELARVSQEQSLQLIVIVDISVVNVALPVTQTYLVKVGDPVTVTLPDNSTADGTTTAVGTVATAASNSGSSNGNSARD